MLVSQTPYADALYELNQPAYLVRPITIKKRANSIPTQGFVFPFVRADDRFTLLSRIGRGAYGEVFTGIVWRFLPARGWRRDERIQAIKILRRDFLCDARTDEEYDAAMKAFEIEADFLQQMQVGPDERCHVPRTQCDGQGQVDCRSKTYKDDTERRADRVQAFTIMEYLAGGDLKFWTLQGMVFDELQAYLVFQDLISSVRALHDRGICHRDLKPENLVFDDVSGPAGQGRLRIIDLGLAAWISDAPFTILTGTNRWMAPEVVELADEREDGGFDESVDVYGAGAILSWLLSSYWDPVGRTVEFVSADFAMENWLSKPVVKVIEACCSNAPFRASLKDLKPLMKTWRKHLVRETQQTFDKIVAIQPEGRDCRRVAPERADYIFDRFRMTLPRPESQKSYVETGNGIWEDSGSTSLVTPDDAGHLSAWGPEVDTEGLIGLHGSRANSNLRTWSQGFIEKAIYGGRKE